MKLHGSHVNRCSQKIIACLKDPSWGLPGSHVCAHPVMLPQVAHRCHSCHARLLQPGWALVEHRQLLQLVGLDKQPQGMGQQPAMVLLQQPMEMLGQGSQCQMQTSGLCCWVERSDVSCAHTRCAMRPWKQRIWH
jgi:hypothetical protein